MTTKELKERVEELEKDRKELIDWLNEMKDDVIENTYNDYLDGFKHTIEFINNQNKQNG